MNYSRARRTRWAILWALSARRVHRRQLRLPFDEGAYLVGRS